MSKKKIQAMCSNCDGETNHRILFSLVEKDVFDIGDGTEKHWTDYMVIRCKGCDTIQFMTDNWNNTDKDEEGNPEHYYIVYPDDFSEIDQEGFLDYEDQYHLPRPIAGLYEEISDAFANDSKILAGLGLRTLVEAICIDQNISGDVLKTKIEGLLTEGHISKNELPILDKLRLIGNISAHQIKSLPMNKLEHALGIVNHILKSIYILPKLDKKLKLTTDRPGK